MEEIRRKNRKISGITLIALVVSIIVLLILAGVSIAMLSGNNGIVKQAIEAKNRTEIAEKNEEKQINDLSDIVNEMQTGVRARNISKYVHYEVDITGDSSFDNDWRVFYEEKDTTYLIAADYIPIGKVPSATGMQTGDTYSAWWDTFKSTGTADISGNVANQYKLSWWKDNKTNTNKNAMATADLLDSSLWSDFAIYSGIEAKGAPTLEMLIASWNAKEYETLYWDYNEIGYMIGTEKNPTTRSVNVKTIGSKGYYDTLYFPHINTETEDNYMGCKRYFLASPNMSGKANTFIVAYDGGIGSGGVTAQTSGLRPIIAVPSSLIGENQSSGKQIYFIEQ